MESGVPPVVKVRFCSVSIMSGGVEQETLLETLLGLGGGRASFLAAVSCVLEMRLGDSLLLLLEVLVLALDSRALMRALRLPISVLKLVLKFWNELVMLAIIEARLGD